MPSDGGLYSCMAVSNSGNASRDVAIYSKGLRLLMCFMMHFELQNQLPSVDK